MAIAVGIIVKADVRVKRSVVVSPPNSLLENDNSNNRSLKVLAAMVGYRVCVLCIQFSIRWYCNFAVATLYSNGAVSLPHSHRSFSLMVHSNIINYMIHCWSFLVGHEQNSSNDTTGSTATAHIWRILNERTSIFIFKLVCSIRLHCI